MRCVTLAQRPWQEVSMKASKEMWQAVVSCEVFMPKLYELWKATDVTQI